MSPARLFFTLSLAASCAAALAHDTWFEALPASATAPAPAAPLLALGTGNQFPLFDSGIDMAYVLRQGCRTVDGPPRALQRVRNDDTTLVLRPPAGASTCWVQLQPFEVELAADKIEIYLKDILATPEVRTTWAAMHARGLPWRERYTKHARIELGAASAERTPLGLDLHIESEGQPLRAGQTMTVQALRDGLPLAGLALELRSDTTPLGLWRRTDAQGRIQVPLPFAGHWLLRGVDLRVAKDPAGQPQRWESRFVTLAFDVPG